MGRFKNKLKRFYNRLIIWCCTLSTLAVVVYFVKNPKHAYYFATAVFVLMSAWLLLKIKTIWGKTINKNGYVILNQENDLEHRYIAKQVLSRELYPNEVVHHINGRRQDNSIQNLCVMDREKHEHFHSWLSWKKAKLKKYPSLSEQKCTLVEEYSGILLTNPNRQSARKKQHQAS